MNIQRRLDHIPVLNYLFLALSLEISCVKESTIKSDALKISLELNS